MQTQKRCRYVSFTGTLTIAVIALALAPTFVTVPVSSFAQGNGNTDSVGSMDKNQPVFDIVLDTAFPTTSGSFERTGQIFEQGGDGTTPGTNAIGTVRIVGSVDTKRVAHVQLFQDLTKRGLLLAAGFLHLSTTPGTGQAIGDEEKLAVLGGTDDFQHVTGELIVIQETTGTRGLTLHIEADLRRARLGTRDGGGTTGGTTAGTTSGTTTSGGTTSGTTSGGTTSGTTSGGTTSGTTTSGGTTSGTTSGGTTSGTTTGGTSGGTTAGTTSGTTSGTTGGDTTGGATTAGGTTSGTTGGGTTPDDTTPGGTTSGTTTSGTTSGSTTSGNTTGGGTTSGMTTGAADNGSEPQ